MEAHQSPERIREVAKKLDDALETRNADQILPFFADFALAICPDLLRPTQLI